jgi:hypothetical protein
VGVLGGALRCCACLCDTYLSPPFKRDATTATTTAHPHTTTNRTADPDAYAFQPENALKLKAWAPEKPGEAKDTTLLDLIPFLQVRAQGEGDVRAEKRERVARSVLACDMCRRPTTHSPKPQKSNSR